MLGRVSITKEWIKQVQDMIEASADASGLVIEGDTLLHLLINPIHLQSKIVGNEVRALLKRLLPELRLLLSQPNSRGETPLKLIEMLDDQTIKQELLDALDVELEREAHVRAVAIQIQRLRKEVARIRTTPRSRSSSTNSASNATIVDARVNGTSAGAPAAAAATRVVDPFEEELKGDGWVVFGSSARE